MEKLPIGTILKNGYRHGALNGVRRYEHRRVIENALGIILCPEQHIHHKNGNKLDNRIENLVVMSREEHERLHAIKNGLGKDRKGIEPPNKTAKYIIQNIKDLRKQGLMLWQIQKHTKLSYPTVQKYAKRLTDSRY